MPRQPGARLRRLIPPLSETERQALAAGTVWIDGALFSGHPDLRELAALPYPTLTTEERAFLDGPVEEACRLLDPAALERTGDLDPRLWEHLRAHGFFGLLLPREHGGRGFSALLASAVFGKLASRSPALSAIVLIPNSVGPGELLLHHGTAEQRAHWLPRLARGEEIPCFALTEPEAGSDAAALRSRAVVERGADGEPWLALDFEKRYITLAPIATLIGLAVRLEDPAELLGRGPAPGITVVLLPARTPGVEIGARHAPLVPFPNGPIRGRGVRVPASAILGGAAGAGQGWRMLMEALSAGRSVSLPAQSVGGAKFLARTTGAYAAVREQFGRPLGAFAGVAEKLAPLAGLTYSMEALRVLTCGAVDAGERPAVVSALVKLEQTELLRELAAHALDVWGGAAVVRGPRNLVGDAWVGAPVGITVEGANVLTRTLIVFGQGAMRCHPWTRRELAALEAGKRGALLRAMAGHTLHALRNAARATLLGVSRGRLARAPVRGPAARHWRRLAWGSARFALWADVALVGLGPRLRAEGAVAGRLADMLGALLRATATLRRFAAEGERGEDVPLLEWALADCFARYQRAFEGLLANLPVRGLRALLRGPVAWWARLNRIGAPPDDVLGRRVAAILQQPGAARDRLTAGLYLPADDEAPLARLERALAAALAARPLVARVRAAQRAGTLPPGDATGEPVLAAAVERGVIAARDAQAIVAAGSLRAEVVRVDETPPPAPVAAAVATATLDPEEQPLPAAR